MDTYKSRKILFFQKGKIICLGDETVPFIINIFYKKPDKKQRILGKFLEYATVSMFVLSVAYLVNIL